MSRPPSHKCSRVLHPVLAHGVESCARTERGQEEKRCASKFAAKFFLFQGSLSLAWFLSPPLFFPSPSLPATAAIAAAAAAVIRHMDSPFPLFLFCRIGDCELLVCIFYQFASATTALSLLSST